MTPRIPVRDVSPTVDEGRYPAKAAVGEHVVVGATVFREGHDAVAANVVLTDPDGRPSPFTPMRLVQAGTSRWEAVVVPDRTGWWSFSVEAWSDPLGTWRHDAEIKLPLVSDVDLVCEEGARLYERAAEGVPADRRGDVLAAVHALRDASREPVERAAAALEPSLVRLTDEHPLRELISVSPAYRLWVDRPRAVFGSWYELFPRSEGADLSVDPPRSGTFATAAERLPAVADMGFDVVYLPPIHPIGTAFRKGPNNTLTPGPGDPGSPWAIGGPDGGHDAVHPDLGTLEDFDAFVARAGALGMEVALDLALQVSPDHPWAAEHPEWFTVRADGSIAYAENPPKKYQDIYPVNFDRDPAGIYAEVERVVRHWMTHGVRIFRVDNPHTKPVRFWEWLIARIHATDPDVVFLAEAFTKPPMMHTLARAGFTQSYSYFTWRTGRAEIEEYLAELHGPAADYMRPNFFVNTPDILHAYLQYGGPAAFKVRAALAALLSPSWGVYAGYELYEHVAVRPGSEEYLDSEKYQLRPRDWSTPEERTLVPYLRMLNRVRREHQALQHMRGLVFHPTNSDDVIAFSRRAAPSGSTSGDPGDVVIGVVNLDPHGAREATVQLLLPELGLDWTDVVRVTDEVTGATYDWGEWNYVRLDPFDEPAHVFRLERGDA